MRFGIGLGSGAGLFLVVFLGFAYFHGGGMANQASRFDAIAAFVEPGTPDTGTFRIDRFLFDKRDAA